jgi:hypothetical protein
MKAVFALSLGACFFAASRVVGGEQPTVPAFRPVMWLPATAAAIAAAGAPMTELELAADSTPAHPGDTTVLLVQSEDGGTRQQWALILSVSPLKPGEEKRRSPAFTLYSSTGREHRFVSGPLLPVAIHVLGPYSEAHGAKRAKDIWSGAFANPQFLSLGLDRGVALILRLHEAAARNPGLKGRTGGIGLRSAPFPRDEIERNRAVSDEFGITEAEERAFAGAVPALLDFFRIASSTKGLREILQEAIDIPYWAIVKNGGRVDRVDCTFTGPYERLDATHWGLPAATPVYGFGTRLLILGKPALDCRLAVTAPRVPLLATAGIVGLAAHRPDGTGPEIMVRVMATRPAMAPEK